MSVIKEWKSDGYSLVIKKNDTMGSYMAYIGVPEDHVAAKVGDYEDIALDVHGGLTYADNELTGTDLEADFWIGWDYAHAGDYVPGLDNQGLNKDAKEWSVEEIIEHVDDALEQVKQLTIADCVKAKLRFMPDWFKENVEVKD